MKLIPYSAGEYTKSICCPFCKKMHDNAYLLHPSNDDEWNILTQDLGAFDVGDWFVCENCLDGHCGAVPGRTPTMWFKEKYPELLRRIETHDK